MTAFARVKIITVFVVLGLAAVAMGQDCLGGSGQTDGPTGTTGQYRFFWTGNSLGMVGNKTWTSNGVRVETKNWVLRSAGKYKCFDYRIIGGAAVCGKVVYKPGSTTGSIPLAESGTYCTPNGRELSLVNFVVNECSPLTVAVVPSHTELCQGQGTTFYANTGGSTTRRWALDGVDIDQPNVYWRECYNMPGEVPAGLHNVTVTGTNACGQLFSDTKPILVKAVASVDADVNLGVSPAKVNVGDNLTLQYEVLGAVSTSVVHTLNGAQVGQSSASSGTYAVSLDEGTNVVVVSGTAASGCVQVESFTFDVINATGAPTLTLWFDPPLGNPPTWTYGEAKAAYWSATGVQPTDVPYGRFTQGPPEYLDPWPLLASGSVWEQPPWYPMNIGITNSVTGANIEFPFPITINWWGKKRDLPSGEPANVYPSDAIRSLVISQN